MLLQLRDDKVCYECCSWAVAIIIMAVGQVLNPLSSRAGTSCRYSRV